MVTPEPLSAAPGDVIRTSSSKIHPLIQGHQTFPQDGYIFTFVICKGNCSPDLRTFYKGKKWQNVDFLLPPSSWWLRQPLVTLARLGGCRMVIV